MGATITERVDWNANGPRHGQHSARKKEKRERKREGILTWRPRLSQEPNPSAPDVSNRPNQK